MVTSKTYRYDYYDIEDDNKNAKTMIEEILADPELSNLQELKIGRWGDLEDDCQSIIYGIISHADKFSNLEHLFLGDMDSEECEVSWIEQGDYSKLWKALPQLKGLTIKGSNWLNLGDICHENLESLTIICGGLPRKVLSSIQNAKLPNLKKLLLYIGVDDYGWDGSLTSIKAFLRESNFPKLTYLGLVNSAIQDKITEQVLESKYIDQIHTLDLSCGALTDRGGILLLNKIPSLPNMKVLDLHYHYLSDEMIEKLSKLPLEIDLSDQNDTDVYDEDFCEDFDEDYDEEDYDYEYYEDMYPMLTE